GLVLDVLEAHAVRPPDEHRPRVRRVDDTLDDPLLFRLTRVLVGRVDEDREMVQQRPLRHAGIALVELDVRTAYLDPRTAAVRLGAAEAELRVLVRGSLWILREQRDVIEVVVDVGRRLDK